MKNTSTFHAGQAVPLERDNIDTDQIIPKQFLKSIKKSGFGQNLFDAWRYEDEGFPGQDVSLRKVNKEFILNQDKFLDSDILISKKNFGCGSSREHAVWSLLDYGFKVVIAESFADIFYNNSSKNGILLIQLPKEEVDKLMENAERGANVKLSVDLEAQEITGSDGDVIKFEVNKFKKHCLLNGLDDIGLTMQKNDKINDYEARLKISQPW